MRCIVLAATQDKKVTFTEAHERWAAMSRAEKASWKPQQETSPQILCPIDIAIAKVSAQVMVIPNRWVLILLYSSIYTSMANDMLTLNIRVGATALQSCQVIQFNRNITIFPYLKCDFFLGF